MSDKIGEVIWVEGGLLDMNVNGEWWTTYVVLPRDPNIDWTPRTPFSNRPVMTIIQDVLNG